MFYSDAGKIGDDFPICDCPGCSHSVITGAVLGFGLGWVGGVCVSSSKLQTGLGLEHW
jgi:hypothetical protein